MNETKALPFTIARFRNVMPGDLLTKACGNALTGALIYTPDACWVARVDGAALEIVDPDSKMPSTADLASAYEVRAFGPDAELRWVRDGIAGDATLLADRHVATPGTEERWPGTTLDILSRRYFVWGKPPKQGTNDTAPPKSAPDHWTPLSTGRIGTIHVPCDDTNAEVAIEAREYVVRDPSGNAVVLFERLVGFKAVPAGDI